MSAFDWNWTFAVSILPALLKATGYTVFATLASFVGALILGLPLAICRNARSRLLRAISTAFVEFVRGTPILIQIYFLYFTLPAAGIVLPALLTGVLALSIHYATYVSEAYRAGIASVAREQWEAASALGLRSAPSFFLVIFPQALRPIVPALGNYLIALFKETPLLSAIAIVELLQTAKIIASDSFRYTEPITIVGLVFLALSLVSARALRWLEVRMALGR